MSSNGPRSANHTVHQPVSLRTSSDALGLRLRQLRISRRLSLQQVASLTGVSKSMLSKIELGQASPTATVLGRIAEGFGVSISHLLGGPTGADSVVMRVIEQPIFQVPKTGFVRRSVSPMRGSKGVDVAFNILPPGQSSGRFPPHRPGVEETLVVVKGQLTLRLDDSHYELNEGDSICYRADHTHQFDNPSQTDETRFIIVINNMPAEY
ncbi:MAG: XRE family transcriptional regulator [Pseudorhodoplanes sp.]|nr:XRE family transcriptional regulator [Pseudorhodoplanes sp.]